MDDAPNASDLCQVLITVTLHHGDDLVCVERVLRHLTVTRLENMQRQQGVGKQHR